MGRHPSRLIGGGQDVARRSRTSPDQHVRASAPAPALRSPRPIQWRRRGPFRIARGGAKQITPLAPAGASRARAPCFFRAPRTPPLSYGGSCRQLLQSSASSPCPCAPYEATSATSLPWRFRQIWILRRLALLTGAYCYTRVTMEPLFAPLRIRMAGPWAIYTSQRCRTGVLVHATHTQLHMQIAKPPP